MGRTAISSARTAISTARSALTSARTTGTAYARPVFFNDFGITHLWDFRTGKTGENNQNVTDIMDSNMPMSFRGTSALSSVYTSGEYSADLERSNNDYFTTNQRILNNGTSAITFFAWVKRESTGIANHNIITQWEASTNNRGFQFRFANNALNVGLSNNGTAQTFYDSATSYTDTTSWHFIVFTYDTTNRGIFYYDGSSVTTNLSSGSHPASIFSGNISVLIGGITPSAPGNFMDGKIGICGMSTTSAFSANNISKLYNFTGKLMGV